MDSAQTFNLPEPVAFGGREFPVRQLQLKEWGELQAWLKSQHPSPLALALRALSEAESLGLRVTESVRGEALDRAAEATRRWPPAVGSRAWLRAVDSVEGGSARFVRAVLAAGGTDLPDAECQQLLDRATPDELNALVSQAYFGDPPDPKGPTAAATTTGAATTPTPAATTGAPPSGG